MLIYKRIAKPFILPLQIFASITNNTSFSQNSRNNAATHPHWRLLTSPIVEKNMCIFLVVVVAVDILEDDAEDMSENDVVDDVDDDVDDVDVDDDVDDDEKEEEEEKEETEQTEKSNNLNLKGGEIHLFHKTRTKLAASHPHWRLLTSPIVEKKHVHFPYVNSKVC